MLLLLSASSLSQKTCASTVACVTDTAISGSFSFTVWTAPTVTTTVTTTVSGNRSTLPLPTADSQRWFRILRGSTRCNPSRIYRIEDAEEGDLWIRAENDSMSLGCEEITGNPTFVPTDITSAKLGIGQRKINSVNVGGVVWVNPQGVCQDPIPVPNQNFWIAGNILIDQRDYTIEKDILPASDDQRVCCFSKFCRHNTCSGTKEFCNLYPCNGAENFPNYCAMCDKSYEIDGTLIDRLSQMRGTIRYCARAFDGEDLSKDEL